MRPASSGNFTMTWMFHTSKDLMAFAMPDAKLREGPWPVGRLTESRPPEPGAKSARNRRRARTTPTEG
eukprot:10016190-Heterocapsa_arctica.AAC.1